MYKFFAYQKEKEYFILDEDVLKHLKVIRIKDQDFLINYQDEFYLCNFIFPNKALIKEKISTNNELDFDVVVAIPLIKQNHFEIALQKSVELGATKIIPFISEYTDKTNIQIDNKLLRFKKIILEAAQQSFRNKIPALEKVLKFEDLLNLDIPNKILAYENEKATKIEKVNKNTLLIVGPEGGFSKKEIDLATQNNVKIVALTKTILRAETAIIYMLAKIN
ncbi:16S rRNA (uracil(1498)-N(3))-methyltransferase [Mycoplasmopsis arginini]|uniref:16S rRNA (uracil(1498)-N(3))-methyltransferase n=1 Tax=Mycoplasmopsis arginini TaxID=2094 RepID=UPI0005C26CDF|nr:16S rRNA (uracil(1498)-N(3))-methyltransferase [Mycoplasmopsis arginini]CRH54877.1 Ribosomal RNA small subunit methyltransferase E [Chlamydia trachomatis]MDI3351551.1 16S rRNA (uracil(1498)-N(3))-methyltransferase [Mycoplasmopsis arginini]MDI3351992.1 16S rRNA (uracil(1498)-N(3))-methyltransferase [Mycoplasmopsis arginini]CRH56801.1 Ribosomal RNA small subunit methyltransferase E [Chlamydia trachomatis]BAQ54264.1 ribosomal RNA small subunit methyltransferase E [Mycoplasmopsis arginini]